MQRIFILILASIILLVVNTGIAVMKTQPAPTSVQIPITATTTISNVVIDLTDPQNPEVKGDVEAVITLRDPGNGQPIRDQIIRIMGIDLSRFANNTSPASDFFINAAAAAKTALESHGVHISDSVIENIKLVQDPETGALTGATIQVNVKADIRAEGSNDPMATAIMGEQVPDGTVLWETRIRVTLDGNNYTALDPKTTAMKPYIKNIMQNLNLVIP